MLTDIRLGCLGGLICLSSWIWGQATTRPATDLTQWVDPFIGTDAHGHTHPAAMRPFGMVQLGPDTRRDPNDWDGSSGYHYSDSTLYGFSHTHLSGTGVSDFCDILFLPFCGDKSYEPEQYKARFDKKTEHATPGYYAVTLDKNKIGCELTATERVGVHRYTYPQGRERASLLIDLRHRDVVLDASIKVVNDREIEGYRISSSWAKEQHIYFVARFSKRFYNVNCLDLSKQPVVSERAAHSKSVAAFLDFYHDGEPIVVTVGISGTSIEGARRNLEAECPDFDFDHVWLKAEQAWQVELQKIAIETPDIAQKRTFYTALYHALSAPNLWNDVDGRYRGHDQKIHEHPGHDVYHVFSLWDTYRACFPLQALLCPDRARSMIKTFQRQYEQSGVLPVWELAANETNCMIGNHSLPVILEAWQHGLIEPADASGLMEAMSRTVGRDTLGLKRFYTHGYVPADEEAESVSKTLEYAFDAWVLSEFAWRTGIRVDATQFEGSRAFKHLFDPQTRFFRGKSGGVWHQPFDPTEVNFNYTEANAWQYRFAVQQDPGRVLWLVGGEAALDSLFAHSAGTSGRNQADITGLIGQYAHGNEPCHHVAYLYNYTNSPQKTRQRVRQILTTLYSDRPDGLCGNDDCGQMSAWYVWSALGLYPVAPGSGLYDVGQPLYKNATLHLESGKTLRITNQAAPDAPQVRFSYNENMPMIDDGRTITTRSLLAGGSLVFTEGVQSFDGIPGVRALNHYEPLGLPAHVFVKKGERVFEGQQTIELGHIEPDARIVYTLDGSEPTAQSTTYRGPFVITQSCTLKCASLRGDLPGPVEVSYFNVKNNALRVVRAATRYSPQYTARGDGGLTDQLMGGADFRSGGWQGYEGVNLDIVVDLGKKQRIASVWANFLQDENAWIFFPTELQIEVSTDGKKFQPFGQALTKIEPNRSGTLQQRMEVVVSGKAPKARYVRIVGRNRGQCPDWHKGRGFPAWIFVDEVGVE
jgi:predicted alpha-1,2-mannosidase